MHKLYLLILAAGCVGPDELDTAEQAVTEPGMVFRVPGNEGSALSVQLPGREPIVASRIDGELSVVAPVRDRERVQIDVLDADGKILGRATAAITVPEAGLIVEPLVARGSREIAVTATNFQVRVTRGEPVFDPTGPTTLHADFLGPTGGRLDVRDVTWQLASDEFGTLTPDPRSYLDVVFRQRLERPLIDICTESRTICWGTTLPARNQAGVIRRTGHIDTGLDIASVAGIDHTIVLRFVAQYPRAGEGYLLWNGTPGPGEYSLSIGGGSASDVMFRLRLDGVENAYLAPTTFERSNDNTNKSSGYPAGPPTPPLNLWHHIAIRRTGSTIALYFDGTELPTVSGARATYPAGGIVAGSLGIGKGPFLGGAVQFYGLVDDVGVFAAAKSDADILDLAQRARLVGSPIDPQLVGAVTFDGPDARTQIHQPTYLGESRAAVVSTLHDPALDKAVLPLPFQRSTRQLPFIPGDVWAVRQEFDTEFTHRFTSSFCWDFERVPPAMVADRANGIGPGGFYFGGVATLGARLLSVGSGTISHVNPTDFVAFPASTVAGEQEYPYTAHLLNGSYRVGVGDTVTPATVIGQVGTFEHFHFSVHDGIGWGTVTIPSAFSDYEVSRDYGKTWQYVALGMPRLGEWVRRPLPQIVVTDIACLGAFMPDQIAKLHCLDP